MPFSSRVTAPQASRTGNAGSHSRAMTPLLRVTTPRASGAGDPGSNPRRSDDRLSSRDALGYSDPTASTRSGTPTLQPRRARVLRPYSVDVLGYSDSPAATCSGTPTAQPETCSGTPTAQPETCSGTPTLQPRHARVLRLSSVDAHGYSDPPAATRPGTLPLQPATWSGTPTVQPATCWGTSTLQRRRGRVLRPSIGDAPGYSEPPAATRSGTPTLQRQRARVLRPSSGTR